MGIFKNIFGSGSETRKETKSIPWQALESVAQLEVIAEKSKTRTQVLFKHSTTCGISRMVLNMFNGSYNLVDDAVDLYYLDLHAHREVSNAIAEKFQVIHQSPQLLVLKNGTTVFHRSHGSITDVDLNEFV